MSAMYRLDRVVTGFACAVALWSSGASAQGSSHPKAPATAASGIAGVKHVGIPVRDQDRALAFYTDVLGFVVAVDESMGPGPRWVELAIPGSPTRVLLLAGPDVEDRIGAFTNIVFVSRDVAVSYDTMRARGVTFDVPPTALPGGGTNAVFRDPDGNTFALASPDAPETPVPSGEWSATMWEANGQGFPFVAEIATGPGGATITFVIRGERFPTTDVQLSSADLRFMWDVNPGPLVACALERQPGGAFEGTCVDQEEGDSKRLTLHPPGS